MLTHLIFVPNILALGAAKATESKNPRESSYELMFPEDGDVLWSSLSKRRYSIVESGNRDLGLWFTASAGVVCVLYGKAYWCLFFILAGFLV